MPLTVYRQPTNVLCLKMHFSNSYLKMKNIFSRYARRRYSYIVHTSTTVVTGLIEQTFTREGSLYLASPFCTITKFYKQILWGSLVLLLLQVCFRFVMRETSWCFFLTIIRLMLLRGSCLQKLLLVCFFFMYKQKWLFYQGAGYLWLYC